MGRLLPGYMPRGVVALMLDLPDTAEITGDETVVYRLTFTAAPNRIYKVAFRSLSVDKDATNESATFDVKNSADVRCWWSTGTGVTTSDTTLGAIRVPLFDNGSAYSMGVDTHFYLVDPPAGQITVGISLRPVMDGTVYGGVRFLPNPGSHLAVEDVGPAPA